MICCLDEKVQLQGMLSMMPTASKQDKNIDVKCDFRNKNHNRLKIIMHNVELNRFLAAEELQKSTF
jgi:hypothetical protein